MLDYEMKYLDIMAKYIIARDNIPYCQALDMLVKAKSRIEDGGENQDTVLEEVLHDCGPTERIKDIDAWWDYHDQKMEDPTQSQWVQDENYYTDAMEAIVQREYDKHGDSLGGLTQEMVAQELFDPNRRLTMEEAIWAVSGHWEDDFLE